MKRGSMVTDTRSREELVAENKELRFRLEEAEETLHALGSGAADALMVSMPDGGEQVFTLQGSEHPYRVLIETMNEGAVTLTSDGTIVYCNKSMATLLQVPLENLIGSMLLSYVAPADSALFAARLESSTREPQKGEISLLSGADNPTPVLFSCCSVEMSGRKGINVLFTDITEIKNAESQLQIAAERERASKALSDSNERYRSILFNIQDSYIRLDTEGIVLISSPSAARMFGYNSLQNNIGLSNLIFYKNLEHRDLLFEELKIHGKVVDFESFVKRNDGTSTPVSVNAQYYYDAHGKILGTEAFIRDITERKQAEEELKKSEQRFRLATDAAQVSLLEKEVMLKEIHHRVKNNLQVISSLVNLQANTIDDPTVHEHLRDVSARVRSMALVHEKLYQSANLSSVPFDDYVSALLQYLIHAHGNSKVAIRFIKDLQPVFFWVETAVPCGLILNELISNTLKHAFRGRSQGEVRILLHRSPDGTVCLCVSDDGVGLPPELDWRQSESLGLRLVEMLTRQLNATMELNCDNGTEFQLTFKLPEVKKDGERERE